MNDSSKRYLSYYKFDQNWQISITPLSYPKVYIPHTVYDELLSWDYDNLDLAQIKGEWIEVCSVKNKILLADLMIDLDAGEAETIVLAKEIGANILLIDERKGWRIAKEQGVNAIGLIGVLLKAKWFNLVLSLINSS